MFYSVHSALKFKCLGLGLGLATWCLGPITALYPIVYYKNLPKL